MKQRKWLNRLAATVAAVATLLTGGVVASTAMADDQHPIADVGSVTLDKLTDYDGKELPGGAWLPTNIVSHLTGVIEHEEQVHEGDVISIPYTISGAYVILTQKINGSVTGTDGKTVFTASIHKKNNKNGEILMAATKHATEFTGKETFHLNPEFTVDPNRNSREEYFADHVTFTFGSSSKTLAVSDRQNPKCTLNNSLLMAYMSEAGHVASLFQSSYCPVAGDFLQSGNVPASADENRVVSVKITALNGGIKASINGLGYKALMAVDENTVGSVPFVGGDPAYTKVDGDPSWILDPVKASQHLQAHQYAMVQQPDGWLVAFNLGAARVPDAGKTPSNTFDDMTNRQVKRLIDAGLVAEKQAGLDVTFDHEEMQQSAKFEYWSTTGAHDTFTMSSQPTSNDADGNLKGFVDYNANAMDASGSVAGDEGLAGTEVTVKQNGFARSGYTFTGWNTQSDGKGTAYKAGSKIAMPHSGVTLYAQWKADAASLSYDANAKDATGATAKQTGVTDQIVKVAANGFKREGYTFTGWNTQADGQGKTYQKGDRLTLPAGTTVLYAQRDRIPGILSWVKTDKDSGEVLAGSEWTLTPKDGQPIVIADNGDLDQAEADGAFKLTGLDWGEYELMETKAPAGHDPISEPISVVIDAKHTTVNIGDVGNAKTPAKVAYDPNGGQGDTPAYEGHVGDAPNAGENKFTNKDECVEFAGWNTQADGKGKAYRKGDRIDPLTGDVTLYAQWKAKADCPAAPGELGKTGSGIVPLAIAMGVVTLLGAGMLILRRRRHGQHV